MEILSKNIFTIKVVYYLELVAVTVLLIGLDHIVPTLITPTSAFPTSIKARDNDNRDLVLSFHEKKTLDLFKDRVARRLPEAYMNTDFYLIRWIRITNFNIEEAENLLMENIKWREDNHINTILNEDFSDIKEDYFVTTDTHDKKGRPIVSVNMGSWDLRSAVLQGKIARVTRYSYWFHEILVSKILEAQQNGKNVTRAVILIDMDGYNLFQQSCPACIGFQVNNVMGIQTHYPMFWEAFVTINTPSIFNLALNAAGGILKPELKETLNIFTHEKKKWMDYLDERIDRDQRYTNFGGTKQLKDH